MKKYLFFLLLPVVLFAVANSRCSTSARENEVVQEQTLCDSSALEIPKLTQSMPEQILTHMAYTASYNYKTKNANWVAWHLTADHTDGPYTRKGIPYAVDDEIKGDRQELTDWYNLDLPLDHGHLCPAGDNKWDKTAMTETFLLSNICPQDRELNGGNWERLENRCRQWARYYGDLYIATGPIFYSNRPQTIGNGVAIPDAFFKVALCMSDKPKALGFIYPNEGTRHEMDYYVLTVDEVEEVTGIDFFHYLPDSIEVEVEAQADLQQWRYRK